ncbi:MAG: ABC transporter ATP-binding protein [Bacteroidia bacterium]|nr:ABC transporter ATP-binding protein [Bacteroidia bacterium]
MLKLTDINRKLGDFALTDINLEIPEGQYYVLLGRSGSGKTQLLELIAGLEYPDSGTIMLDNEDITRRRIQDRKVGIVFQDYAVFPHMTVFGNIAYPLKARKEDKKSIAEKVEKAATAMNIKHILERNTEKLSGGELQRVALARTLITSPRLLLLDEPLSSLDASLKDDMKRLLRNLNKAGQTIIHVTHDYNDAISLAKRVGVIHNGRIIQEGSVDEVFKNPSNRFVARYAGIRNFFRVEITREKGILSGITKHNVMFKLEGENRGKDGLLIIKSDSIVLTKEMPEDTGHNIIKGKITEIIPSEFGMEITLDAGDLFYVNILTPVFEKLRFVEEEEVWMSFPSKAIVALKGTV